MYYSVGIPDSTARTEWKACMLAYAGQGHMTLLQDASIKNLVRDTLTSQLFIFSIVSNDFENVLRKPVVDTFQFRTAGERVFPINLINGPCKLIQNISINRDCTCRLLFFWF